MTTDAPHRPPLATLYRPRRFADVAGQTASVMVLHRMAQRGAVPPAVLLYGAKGTGKTTSARILGAALNCHEKPGPAAAWPCGLCPACEAVIAGNSIDVIEIDAASNGSVERIREIRELVQYGTSGEWRVVLLDEAQSMSRDAFNTLLKVLEEPPHQTVFVLITTERGKILSTVVSRCMPFRFGRLAPATIAARLREICDAEQIPAEDALLAYLAQNADGAMRDGIMLLDQAASVGIRTLSAWRKLGGEEDYAPAILSAAAAGDHKDLFSVLDHVVTRTGDYASITAQLVSCLRDLLVLLAGGDVTATGTALEERRELAAELDSARVVAAMTVLWDLQVRVRTEDKRAGLELAAVMVSEKLHGRQAPRTAASNGNGHVKTAADLGSMDGFTVS